MTLPSVTSDFPPAGDSRDSSEYGVQTEESIKQHGLLTYPYQVWVTLTVNVLKSLLKVRWSYLKTEISWTNLLFSPPGGIASSLDDVWSTTGLMDPTSLVTVLERFHHGQYAKKSHGKENTSWDGILQNILSFRLADGSFHDADGSSDLR